MSRVARHSADPRGEGPLAHVEPREGRPIEDPVLADHSNPRWDEESPDGEPELDAQPLANPDGSSNVMPADALPADPREALASVRSDGETGTEQDPAARSLAPDGPGRDNIREGLGGGTANPAAAEGGDNG